MATKLKQLAGRETEPVRRQASQRSTSAGRSKPEAQPAEQVTAAELRANNPTAEMPSMVRNGLMAVTYLRPHFDVDKDERTCSLEFSVELTADHEGVIPKRMAEGWEDVEHRGYKRIDVPGVPMQLVDIRLAPDDKKSDLHLNGVVEKVSISKIEDKGTGESKDVVRLSFRTMFDLTQTVEQFACRHFGKTVWIRLAPVQGELN